MVLIIYLYLKDACDCNTMDISSHFRSGKPFGSLTVGCQVWPAGKHYFQFYLFLFFFFLISSCKSTILPMKFAIRIYNVFLDTTLLTTLYVFNFLVHWLDRRSSQSGKPHTSCSSLETSMWHFVIWVTRIPYLLLAHVYVWLSSYNSDTDWLRNMLQPLLSFIELDPRDIKA